VPIPHARGGYVEKVAVRIASRALLSQAFRWAGGTGADDRLDEAPYRQSDPADTAHRLEPSFYTRGTMEMESGSETLEDTLSARVDELIRSHKGQRLLSTTGSRGSIEELAARIEGLEQAIREIARDVQKVTAVRRR
jgi:hypothetical protein